MLPPLPLCSPEFWGEHILFIWGIVLQDWLHAYAGIFPDRI